MSRNLTVAARRVKHGQDRSSNVLGLRLDNRSSFLQRRNAIERASDRCGRQLRNLV